MHNLVQRATFRRRVTLLLRCGRSPDLGWILWSGRGSALITVGANHSSDWRVDAVGVAGHAMSIGFVDDALYAASGPGAHVTIDGHPLTEAWQKITGPAVLALGAARLELFHEWAAADLEAGRVRRLSHSDAPSLLQGEMAMQSGADLLWRAAFGLLTVVSYLAWLYLLDHV